MNWLLIDNILPNQPVVINLDNLTDITWAEGTMSFETVDGQNIEYECEKSVFIDVISQLHIVKEIE